MDQKKKMALYESTCNFHSVNKRRNGKEWRVLESRKQHSVFYTEQAEGFSRIIFPEVSYFDN